METQKFFFLSSFIISLIVFGCLLTSIGTDQMVKGQVTQPNVTALNYGKIKFGLIWGTKQYNYGYGERNEQTYIVYEEYKTDGKDMIPATITTLCFAGIATIFTLLSVIFSLMNTMTVPIQTIHGPHGLYIWNGIAAGCGFIALIVYTVIFKTYIEDNIQSPDEETFDLTEKVQVGYSFWILMSAVILVLGNIGVVILAHKSKDPNFLKLTRKVETNDKHEESRNVADGIIY